jgi:hypothetical protein
MNFYPPGGSFKFHRDEFLHKSGNCKPVADAELMQTKRYVHKADEGRVTFRACKDNAHLKRIDTRCYGMGSDGRGVTSMTEHMAEPGPGVTGWDSSLVIDCTPAQHAQLQELITADLSSDCIGPRPEIGEGIELEGLPSWDVGVYQSERNNKLIDDGTGNGTLERACVVGGKKSVEVRTQHHIISSPFAWAKTAEASGLGVERFEGYNLGRSNTEADKDAIKRAATQQEVRFATTRCKKKLGVAKALNINSKDRIYTRKTGAFKQQFDQFLPPTPTPLASCTLTPKPTNYNQ